MGKSSGGIITYNLREGFRSESLAHYVFSAFGPCLPINTVEDFGFDLLCNLADIKQKMMLIKSSFGVQVKSKGFDFEFKGDHVIQWLSSLEIPFLLAVISKNTTLIEIYTTWNLNRLLLELGNISKTKYPNKIKFVPDNNKTLKFPTIKSKSALIPIGKPILSFNISDLGNPQNRQSYRLIMGEWIEMDATNYKNRRAGLPICYGYTEWQSNLSLVQSRRGFDKKYFFGPTYHKKVNEIIIESAIVAGNYLKNTYNSNPKSFKLYKNEFNKLRNYILSILKKGNTCGELFNDPIY